MTDQARLIAALDQLPTLPRLVYLLSAADGFSHAAIAFRLGMTGKEIEMHLAEALYQLDRILNGDMPLP